MRTRLFSQLMMITLLVSLCSGCSVINSILGKDPNPPVGPGPINPEPPKNHESGPNGNGEGYGVVTNYYRIKPNYKCTNKDGIAVQSYKDSLQVDETAGTFKQTGDKCSSEPISTGKNSTLEVSNGIISYGNGIYQKEVK